MVSATFIFATIETLTTATEIISLNKPLSHKKVNSCNNADVSMCFHI